MWEAFWLPVAFFVSWIEVVRHPAGATSAAVYQIRLVRAVQGNRSGVPMRCLKEASLTFLSRHARS